MKPGPGSGRDLREVAARAETEPGGRRVTRACQGQREIVGAPRAGAPQGWAGEGQVGVLQTAEAQKGVGGRGAKGGRGRAEGQGAECRGSGRREPAGGCGGPSTGRRGRAARSSGSAPPAGAGTAP